MSSKLLRGANVATEAVAWPRVSSSETIAGDGQPAGGYLSEPSAPHGPSPARDIERRLEAAQRAGFEEGRAAGRSSLEGEAAATRQNLACSIEELTGTRLRARREAEQDVVALALAVARRILHRELTVAPEALLGVVKAALEKMDAREVHQVRVSLPDAAPLRQFFEQMGPPQRMEVIADAALGPGCVLIESSRGVLDASVDTQLAEIGRGFADIVRTS